MDRITNTERSLCSQRSRHALRQRKLEKESSFILRRDGWELVKPPGSGGAVFQDEAMEIDIHHVVDA